MARVQFFDGSTTLAGDHFGEFTEDSLTAFSSTRVELTGADGQQFVVFGTGFSFNQTTGAVTGTIDRIDWLDPDGGLMARVSQLDYSAQRAFDAVIGDPGNPNVPDGPEGLFVDALSGDDLTICGPTVGGGYYEDSFYDFNRVFVGTGNDTVIGGAGNERITSGNGGTIRFNGGGGRDSIDYLDASFFATHGITANLQNGAVINPFGGIDRVTKVESLIGTVFDDVIRGNNIANNLGGGTGGHDRLYGYGGDDQLFISFDATTTGLDEVLDGGTGNDFLRGGSGRDRIFGGPGRDTVSYLPEFDDPAIIVVDLVTPANSTGNFGDDVIRDVEVFEVTWGDTSATQVRFFGDEADNTFLSRLNSTDNLNGGFGNDTLSAGVLNSTEADTVRGGAGNDVLTGGNGADLLDGGAGVDMVLLREFNFAKIDLLDPSANEGEVVGDRFVGIEAYSGVTEFLGGNRADIAIASEQYGGHLSGRAGNDILTGAGREDSLSGGAGNDRLNGGIVDRLLGTTDTLNGGTGNDLIIGGAGIDRLTGAGGADVFFCATLNDTGSIGNFDPGQRDHISDFTLGVELLRFAKSGFRGLQDNFGFVAAASPIASASIATFLFDTDDGRLLYDLDGSGQRGAFLLTVLDGTTHLTRSAFDVV